MAGGFISPEIPVFVAGPWEAMRYLGSTIVVDHRDIAIISADGDIHYCYSMSSARKWARDKRREQKGAATVLH